MQKTFIVYSDPGHAWARVSFVTLRELGIEDKISAFSYQRNGFAFLEEDCDLSVLILALRADRKSTRLNSSHVSESRMPSSA